MPSISRIRGWGAGRVFAWGRFAAIQTRPISFPSWVTASLMAVAALGCGDGLLPCQAAQCERSDVFVATWWGESMEGGPGWLLQNAVKEQPFVDNVYWALSANTHAELRERLATEVFVDPADNPARRTSIDAFLANGGWDVLQWTPCGRSSQSHLLPLNDFYPFGSAEVDLDPSVLAAVQCRGQTYAVPLGLHQVNFAIVNEARARRCRDAPPEPGALGSFRAWLTCLGETSTNAPLVVAYGEARPDGDPGDFGESLQFLVENLMLLGKGASGYQSFWRMDLPTAEALNSRQLLSDTLTEIGKLHADGLIEFVNSRSRALNLLSSEGASAMVMPDWYLSAVRQKKKPHLTGISFPGTESFFLYTSDVFAVPQPRSPRNQGAEPGLRWLDAMLSPTLQNRFATQKPALPALRNARSRPLRFDRREQMVPTLSTLLPRGPEQLARLFADWSQQMDLSDNSPPVESELLAELRANLDVHLRERFCQFQNEALQQPVQSCVARGVDTPLFCTQEVPERPAIMSELCPAL